MSHRLIPRRPRRIAAAALAILLCGCAPRQTAVRTNNPQLDAFIELMTPRRIEIQRYLTRAVSFDGSGNPDGIELVLAAKDAFGDEVKCVGTILVELYRRPKASPDRLGRRVVDWQVDITTAEKLSAYWDNVARCVKLPLVLPDVKLHPGRYVLTAQLTTPTGQHLQDRYEFTIEPGLVPRPTTTR